MYIFNLGYFRGKFYSGVGVLGEFKRVGSKNLESIICRLE